MQDLKAELLRGLWYVALPGADLRPGRMAHKTLLGEPLLIGRGCAGQVFALRDICPHRGIPLHYGRFDGESIACSYHGWRFDMGGTCVEIPSLREGQQVDFAKIRCGSYPCVERQGVVWVYFPRADETSSTTAPPRMPVFADEAKPTAAIMLPFPCSTDHAAFGLMDPTHAAFVHTSWWFKKEATKLRPKEKQFEPIELGWRMVRHPLPPQNLVYKLLGRNVETEISYQLRACASRRCTATAMPWSASRRSPRSPTRRPRCTRYSGRRPAGRRCCRRCFGPSCAPSSTRTGRSWCASAKVWCTRRG